MTRYGEDGSGKIYRVTTRIPEQEYSYPVWNYKVNPAVIDHYETRTHLESEIHYGPYANRRPATQVRNKHRKDYARNPYFKNVTVEVEECLPEWKVVEE